MRTFFISDLHFGHANCIRFDDRPWETVEEMDEGLIKLWNQKVSKADHVYVVGDFAYKNSRNVHSYVEKLNGYIHLIRGNHDKRSPEYESAFRDVHDYMEIPVMVSGVKCRVVLCHYFQPFYNSHRHMGIHLHGHSHRTEESTYEDQIKEMIRAKGIRCEAYNVGCMWQDYQPQTLEEIIARQGRKVDII
ncbi:MAG: metallophosphoesterase family protein [Blautia sp.]|nr:metallophosphoesterase family protein [Blautia sp.]